jgi:glycosyltransferase involved in cell wall biosynthesis
MAAPIGPAPGPGTARRPEKSHLTILHIAPTPFFSDRGCHVRVRGLTLALNRRSHRNIVCTYPHGRDVAGIETVRIRRIKGYTKAEAGPSPFKYVADLLLFLKVCDVLRRERPDIIHGHLHEGALIGWAARMCFFWRRIPLVFDMQGSLVGELAQHGYVERRSLKGRLFSALEYLITRMPDVFVCSSGRSASVLMNEFHVPRERIAVVHDGTDIVPAKQREEGARPRSAAEDRGQPVVVYTGGLLEAKGLGALREVILEAHRRGLPCRFMLVGYPVATIAEFIREHGLRDFCALTGRVPLNSWPSIWRSPRSRSNPKPANPRRRAARS